LGVKIDGETAAFSFWLHFFQKSGAVSVGHEAPESRR